MFQEKLQMLQLLFLKRIVLPVLNRMDRSVFFLIDFDAINS